MIQSHHPVPSLSERWVIRKASQPDRIPALVALVDLPWGVAAQHPARSWRPVCVDDNYCVSSGTNPEQIFLIVRHGHVCNFSSPPFVLTDQS